MKKNIIIILIFLFFMTPADAGNFFEKLGNKINSKDGNTAINIIKSLSVSEEDEREIGIEASRIIISKFGLYKDEILTKYISLIGGVIVSNCERPELKFHFNILNTDEINAFACPGGYIFLTKGAVSAAKNEDELAAVISHEVSHITLKHELKEIRKSGILKELSQRFAEKNREVVKKLADFVVNNLLVKGRNRNDEYEADAHSLNYLKAHNYNAFLHLYLMNLNRQEIQSKLSYLQSTHPPANERIQKLSGISDFIGSPVELRMERFKFSTMQLRR